MPPSPITRRRFLQGTAMSAAGLTILPRHALGRPGRTSPNEKLNIAGIGVGGMGAANLAALESENIVALCDVDHEYAAKTFKKYPNARVWRDYREMLEEQKDIDAVVIATPDHTHAVISIAAMRAGKHVYCQKPLTHNIAEARRMVAVARETRVVTQMGIQGHSGEGARLICEWIAAGAIGDVRAVDAWCALSYYPWGHEWWSSRLHEPAADAPDAPATLDWNLWLGPAALRPYHPTYHPCTWRAWLDFGCGMMGDRGVHTLDPVVWALRLGAPTRVEASSLGGNEHVHSFAGVVTFEFAARGEWPPVTVRWYDGLRAPRPPELEPERRMGDGEGGVIFHGSKGRIMCGTYGEGPRLIPESAMKALVRPPETLARVPDSHEQDWVRACKLGQAAGADFAYGALVTEICHLGNIARRVDAPIEWDAERMRVNNHEAANRLIGREYRSGWSL